MADLVGQIIRMPGFHLRLQRHQKQSLHSISNKEPIVDLTLLVLSVGDSPRVRVQNISSSPSGGSPQRRRRLKRICTGIRFSDQSNVYPASHEQMQIDTVSIALELDKRDVPPNTGCSAHRFMSRRAELF